MGFVDPVEGLLQGVCNRGRFGRGRCRRRAADSSGDEPVGYYDAADTASGWE